MRKTRMLLTAAIVLAALPLAWAAGYKIDAAHTTVMFSIRHIFTDVQGKFQKFDGTIEYDPANAIVQIGRAHV